MTYRIHRAPLGTLRLAIPEDARVLFVEGENLRSWEVADGVLAVLLHTPAEHHYRLAVTIEVDLPDEGTVSVPEIAALFDLYKAEAEKSVDVEVTSAFALNQEQQDKLAKVLSARLNREVRLQASEDASLIGGVVIRAGDLVIDGSIRGKIAKLAEALKS
jgi:hypothetical protein